MICHICKHKMEFRENIYVKELGKCEEFECRECGLTIYEPINRFDIPYIQNKTEEGSMNKEDIRFLKELQHEMRTQDTVSQANPRFWVIMQTVRDYWIDDNTDGMFIYSINDGDSVFEGELEELTDWIKELDGVENCKYDVCYVEFDYEGEEYLIGDTNDLQLFLDEYDKDNYSIGYYRNREEIVPSTMFLTLRECKEHIKGNGHHYNKTVHPYAMTAWRSPQVEKLYEILENTNWENIK